MGTNYNPFYPSLLAAYEQSWRQVNMPHHLTPQNCLAQPRQPDSTDGLALGPVGGKYPLHVKAADHLAQHYRAFRPRSRGDRSPLSILQARRCPEDGYGVKGGPCVLVAVDNHEQPGSRRARHQTIDRFPW